MKTFDGIPIPKEEGYCPGCGGWHELRSGEVLPRHRRGSTDKPCVGSGVSPSHIRYVITTKEELFAIGSFLQALSKIGNDPCIVSRRNKQHSGSCRDGNMCRNRIMRYVLAVLDYTLPRFEIE
jgi:hypothetical protein